MAGDGGGRRPERETFYEAQRRHRRSGWRFSVLSVMAVGLLGLPLSVVVSPFVSAVGLMALDVVNLVVPMPDPGADIGRFVERLSDSDDDTVGGGGVPDQPVGSGPVEGSPPGASDGSVGEPGVTEPAGGEPPGSAPAGSEPAGGVPTSDESTGDESTSGDTIEVRPREVATVGVALVVPGMVLMGVTWRGVRRLFLRSGAGAVVLASGARPPRPGDLEERQLVNLVEEMSLAAGVPPPRVMLLDSDLVNAAVVGRSIDDAVLIVPRRMLDDLGRGPTGALVADLLAVVVNGDLRMALVIASVFQTFDLVGATLTAPYSRHTRRVLWRLCRMTLRRRPPSDQLDTEAHFVASELAVAARFGSDDPDDQPKGGCVTTILQLPFLVASIAYTLTRLIVGGLFVAPIMAALWRRRRLLADATAVELTRDPDSLMAAFDYLEQHATTVPAGPWTHLFVVGPEVAQERLQRRFEQRRDQIWLDDRQPGESALGAFRRRTREALEASAEYQREVAPAPAESQPNTDDGSDELASFLPKLGKRRERLAAMGAQPGDDAEADAAARAMAALRRTWSLPVKIAGWVVGLTLLAVMAVLFLMILALLGTLIYLALLFEFALLAPPVALVHVLLR